MKKGISVGCCIRCCIGVAVSGSNLPFPARQSVKI